MGPGLRPQGKPGVHQISKSAYSLLSGALKVPFWDRVQKKRVLKMFFEKKCNRVARSGAGWDPIALLATEQLQAKRGYVCPT